MTHNADKTADLTGVAAWPYFLEAVSELSVREALRASRPAQ
jgi:hypothetical protein